MTVKAAYQRAIAKHRLTVNGNWFGLLTWKSDESGLVSSPFLVTVQGTWAIEIDNHGRFVDAYPASATGYSPYIDTETELEKIA